MDTENIFKNRKKKELIEELLSRGDIYLQVNAPMQTVLVPDHLKDNHMLSLKMSMAFNYQPQCKHPGIEVTLKFDGIYFDCKIPWDSVWGVRAESGESHIFKESIPKEAAKQMAKSFFSDLAQKLKPNKQADSKPNNHLKRIK